VISKSSTLQDVAFEVCSALRERGLRVILVGGSAATYYSKNAYQSDDVDFVAYFDVDASRQSDVVSAMAALGYQLNGNTFAHRTGNRFTVEFPKGPPAVSGDTLEIFNTVRDGGKTLEIITATDCVRDRLAHYFFWDDRTALRAALAVALAQRAHLDLDAVRSWSQRESEEAKFKDFLRRLQDGDA
jgi:hypothetical protein